MKMPYLVKKLVDFEFYEIFLDFFGEIGIFVWSMRDSGILYLATLRTPNCRDTLDEVLGVFVILLLLLMMMMSMGFNVPPTAKVMRGRAILAKGIAERKHLLTRILIRQPILSLISSFFLKISSICMGNQSKRKKKGQKCGMRRNYLSRLLRQVEMT